MKKFDQNTFQVTFWTLFMFVLFAHNKGFVGLGWMLGLIAAAALFAYMLATPKRPKTELSVSEKATAYGVLAVTVVVIAAFAQFGALAALTFVATSVLVFCAMQFAEAKINWSILGSVITGTIALLGSQAAMAATTPFLH